LILLRSLVLALLCTLAAGAAAEPRYYVPEIPADLGAVDFYLLTAGLGPHLHERFGHTGIRVHDKAKGLDVVFNWGKFSFNEPGFALKFYRGSLTYSMGVRTMAAEVESFLDAGRRLVQERLQLTSAQKRSLLEKIAWNARPENRSFAYQYWYKNCATIPRDYLDEALAGQVRARFVAAPAGGVVFRDYVRNNLQAIPFVAPGLDVVMNANIDRPITKWEEMFLPEKLRETLLEMPQIDDEGKPVPGTRLLSDTVVLVDEENDYAAALPDYLLLALIGLVPLGVAGLAFSAKKRRLAFRALGWAGIGWGGLSGFVGTALLLNWFASGHPDTWHNANLLVFFPVDWLFLALGIALVRAGDRIKDRIPFLHAGRVLAAAHLAALALLVALKLLGLVQQDVWRILTWFVVPTAALSLAYTLLAFGDPVAVRTARPSSVMGRAAAARVARLR
jgi:hypothetical protein